METVKIQVKKIHPDAVVPAYAYAGDAGMDLFTVEDYTLQPGERHSFATGIAIKLPAGYVSLVWDKSGLSQKFGIKTLGGVLDSNYTGEYIVGLLNTSSEPYHFEKGHKIAQVLIQRVESATIEVVEEFVAHETPRGAKSFGSSGK